MADDPTLQLILASTSPRRVQLLSEAGYQFRQVAPTFDDTHVQLAGVTPHTTAKAIAYIKAAAVADQLAGELTASHVILGCDTLIALDHHILGKPADEADARRILSQLIERQHRVITGLALLKPATNQLHLATDETAVQIRGVNPDQFDAYIDSRQWRGKAGGYNLAELEHQWRFELTGDRTNVIGLPLKALGAALARFSPRTIPGRD